MEDDKCEMLARRRLRQVKRRMGGNIDSLFCGHWISIIFCHSLVSVEKEEAEKGRWYDTAAI